MLGDLWKKEENSLTKPVAARVDFYESALDTLHKKVSFYLMKRSELDKDMKELAKAFSRVAATERNVGLQESLFRISAGYDDMHDKLDTYVRCREQTTLMIEDARAYLVKPMREVIGDVEAAAANIQKFKKKFPAASALGPGLEQHLSDSTHAMQVSAYLFEKHRTASLRTVAINLLHTELRHHVAAIERISPLLEALYLQHDEPDDESETREQDLE